MSLPDSGLRESFGDGMACREADPAKPAIEGVSPFAIERLGMLMTRANVKYGDYRNWEKGMPYMRAVGGILRHTYAFVRRDDSEDHLASVMWNAMILMHYQTVGGERVEVTPESLDDRPTWNTRREHP